MVESVSTSKYGTPSNVVTFQEKLRQGRTTSTWLDEQLGSPLNFNPARAARKTRRSSPKETKPSVKKSATQEAVESATTQIVNKALRLLKKDTTSGPDVSKAPETPDSLMIGSKGLDAFSGVGRLVEGLANTLDDVIGQAFKDWSTPLSYSSTMRGSGGEEAHNSSSSAEHNASWTDFQVPDKEWEAVPVTSRRRRATTKRTMSPFLSRLGNTSGHESDREAETSLMGDARTSADDLATEQVTEQMQTLLDEKARLAQENSRLKLENEGLKELLAFTLAHQAELLGDHELFVDDVEGLDAQEGDTSQHLTHSVEEALATLDLPSPSSG